MAIRGAGGTEGGLGQFFGGVALTVLGMYLFFERVTVMSSLSSVWGGHLGLVLLPLCLGIAMLFFSGRSIIGWVLTGTSLVGILVGIIANLTFFFHASFWQTVALIACMFAGMVMIARSLRAR